MKITILAIIDGDISVVATVKALPVTDLKGAGGDVAETLEKVCHGVLDVGVHVADAEIGPDGIA